MHVCEGKLMCAMIYVWRSEDNHRCQPSSVTLFEIVTCCKPLCIQCELVCKPLGILLSLPLISL